MEPDKFLTDLSMEDARRLAVEAGLKAFHGKILHQWIFQRGATEVEAMTDLPRAFRDRLAQEYKIHRLRQESMQKSRDGTRKFLFRLPDGHCIETVSIPESERLTLCLSTQVGCNLGCTFCASGQKGLERNLTASEIVEQILLTMGDRRKGLTNLVFMGIGEPLMNLAQLSDAIGIINDPEGIGLGARRMTVSTVGLPQGIRKLAELGLQINLAVSLHAADEEKRQRLIPAAKNFPLPEILEAAAHYRHHTTRDVTFEVLLLRQVNDGKEDAEKLAALLKGQKCLVNLIPFNAAPGIPYEAPDGESVSEFRRILEEARIPTTVRRARGTDIKAACGQLRLDRLSDDR
ncbi:MAG: dual-specificity RNA methyltransferase RlmN [Planctomycetota bacterium]|jgi:23S rRNA (adenine2503-C2)-methyltransferase